MSRESKSKQLFRKGHLWCTPSITLAYLYLMCLILQIKCQSANIRIDDMKEIQTKNINSENDTSHILVEHNDCHTCLPNTSNKFNIDKINNETLAHSLLDKNVIIEIINNILTTIVGGNEIDLKDLEKKRPIELENVLLSGVDKTLSNDYYKIVDGFEIKPVNTSIGNSNNAQKFSGRSFETGNFNARFLNRIKRYAENHILSINIPKAARLFGFRSFGLKKLLLPIIIGVQILKSALIFMFLPSIIGSFGKIVGKGLSQLSAASSQASYPPMNMVEQDAYSADPNKDIMGYETDPEGVYTYPQDDQTYYTAPNEINELSDGTLSRYGPGGAKVTFVPTKNGINYYRNKAQTTDYKVFHKIPASSMILSNYDPFYSPLLSRLDGIFARLDLSPRDDYPNEPKISGQTLSQIKLEACREQLICSMYANPTKYAPYSNLVSAQLSRDLNELRRPTSDNPEILRFFRYMRAARRGQEGADCLRIHPACDSVTTPAHTMIHAYHDINKLVSARKLKK